MENVNHAHYIQVNSEHPLAKAIVDHTRLLGHKTSNLSWLSKVANFRAIVGQGVCGELEGRRLVLVGNSKLMAGFNIDVPEIAMECLKDTEKQARTGILVAIESEIVGLIAISDPLKAEAPAVISILKSIGVQSIMVTGDNWGTANAIAREVGIDRVFAETLPQGKAEKVKELQVCLKM